jgi:hypothetical protein
MSSRLRLVPGLLIDSARDRLSQWSGPGQRLLHPELPPTAANLRSAWCRGCQFLRRAQRRDGAFVDFLLEPGASDVWISAHVAFVLERVDALSGVLERVVDFLERVGQREGLWGYNRRVAPDLDSTAQALMVLQHRGRHLEPAWVDFILAQQAIEGGFPTYAPTGRHGQPAHTWQTPHPDVTLIVAELLRRLQLQAEHKRAFAYLNDVRNSVGIVAPYWWNTPAYSAWASVRAGFEVPTAAAVARRILSQGTSTMPKLAMLLSAATAEASSSEDLTTGLTVLLAQQAEDGSWPCDPCLRVPRPWVSPASDEGSGRQYAGRRRVLSTAHAVAAIADASEAFGLQLAD